MIYIESTLGTVKQFRMKCSALRAACTPTGLGERLRRAFFAASVVSLAGLHAAEVPLPVASANYSLGASQLRVNAVSQMPSAQSRRGFAVSLELQLEIPPAAKAGDFFQLPGGWYLDNEVSPLVAASAVPGKSPAKIPHQWMVDGKTGRITLTELEIGDARTALQAVDFELVLTKVTEWETTTFQALPGRGDFFQCGPFELRANGEPQRLKVDVWAFPQFRDDHERYRKQMPLAFLNSAYGLQELKVVDAAKRVPTSTASSTPLTGAASATFTAWRPGESTEATAAEPVSEDIVYPVTLTMRLPKRFTKERVRFHFNSIPLPAPSAAPR